MKYSGYNESIFYNGTECDVYIGTGAGKMLQKDILCAASSVKVITSYLSDYHIELLKGLSANVKVKLITMMDGKDNMLPRLAPLTKQKRIKIPTAVVQRDKWTHIQQLLLYTSLIWGSLLILMILLLQEPRMGFAALPLVATFAAIIVLKKKIRSLRIYRYEYKQAFPFRVYNGPRRGAYSPEDKVYNKLNSFIHSKVFIIDDTTAYLGSLNFTSSGTKYNLESRIKIEDPKAVREINTLFHTLFTNNNRCKIDFDAWCRRIYDEPIN